MSEGVLVLSIFGHLFFNIKKHKRLIISRL